jgi:hypothetical protein
MNELTDVQVAYLAGIYEGEGTCKITRGRAIRVDIVMTDQDVIHNIVNITGLGHVRTLPQRSENHKTAYLWGVGSGDAVAFLEAIYPWLGQRRGQRALDAINNWRTNKSQSSNVDTHCVNGHSYEAPNRRTKYGTCHLCNLEASRKYREKKRLVSS